MSGERVATCEDFDDLACTNPDCDCGGHGPIHVVPPCHPGKGCAVEYHRDGFLLLRCPECSAELVKIAVAEAGDG